MTLKESMLHKVISPSLPAEIGQDTATASSDSYGAMIEANNTWKGLDAYFQVQGAEGVFQMLERLVVDAEAFSSAVLDGYQHLTQAESTFQSLERRREDLVADIADVNTQLEAAHSALAYEQRQSNMVCYQPGSAAEWQQTMALWNAELDVHAADRAEERLRSKIEKFNRSVEDEERHLGQSLKNVSGGTDVYGSDGEPIRRQWWGNWGASGSSMSDIPMVDRFERVLTTQYISRLDWLLEQNPASIESWLAAHPAFVSGAAMVNSGRMADWFHRHVPREAIEDGWEPEGAWLTLWETAPGTVGNLSGLPASVKDTYNRQYLDMLIAEDRGEEATQHLRQLKQQLRIYGDDSVLLSVFFDGEDPRASVGMGDIDNAEQVFLLTHGIKNDLGSLPAWAKTANEVHTQVNAQGGPETATVAWFGWDSGDTRTVQNNENARTGAARLNADLAGLIESNDRPGITSPHIVAGLHSYGTTMGGEAYVRGNHIFDAVFMNGSPGISDHAVQAYSHAGQTGTSAVHAALADDDSTAGFWGGKIWNFDHRNNPVDFDGITPIDVDGGDGFDRVTGHQAHHSDGEPGYFSPGTASYDAMMEYLHRPVDEK